MDQVEKTPLPPNDYEGTQQPQYSQHRNEYPDSSQHVFLPNQQFPQPSIFPQEYNVYPPMATAPPVEAPMQPRYGTLSGPGSSQSYQSYTTIPPPVGSQAILPHSDYLKKSVADTYIITIVFGLLGAHHFYLHRYSWGILYFFTFGLLTCGYLIDLFRVPYLVKKYNEEHSSPNRSVNKKKDVSDAYVAWFPFGLIGFHHYYLRNYVWGVAYTFTFGILGIGWFIDGLRMPSLVRKANDRLANTVENEKNLCLSYILGIPLGFLGLHHFYLNRPVFGVAYMLTFGLLGIGWVVDWFRMPILVRRCNDEIKQNRDKHLKTVDDCYVLWLPFGLIGYHHFYLGRPLWGIHYHFTFGVFGIGWLIDMFRIPSLVREINEKRKSLLLLQENSFSQENSLTSYSVPYNQNNSFYQGIGIVNQNGYQAPNQYFPSPLERPPSYEEYQSDDEKSSMLNPPPYEK